MHGKHGNAFWCDTITICFISSTVSPHLFTLYVMLRVGVESSLSEV
jgi:hypothetical protein